jgi:tryptophan synthase alpha chain
MSRIGKAFENGKAFIGFLTAGDPSIEKSLEFILEMERAGADLVEIGIPFSDPMAEGPVIQEANIRALASGTDLSKVFHLVEEVRKVSEIPLVFLTYMNPVFKTGISEFFGRCRKTGIDGIIIPDLPFEEKGEVAAAAKENGIDVISLVAPTSENRIRMIAEASSGFLYIVSSMGVTGVRSEIKTDITSIVKAAREATDTKIAVGFGISSPEQAKDIAKTADGVIVGSAIVRIIGEYGNEAGPKIFDYVRSMKEAIS